MKMDGASTSEITKPKHKLYNAMESDDGSANTPLDKGKGIASEGHPVNTGDSGSDKVVSDRKTQETYEEFMHRITQPSSDKV